MNWFQMDEKLNRMNEKNENTNLVFKDEIIVIVIIIKLK